MKRPSSCVVHYFHSCKHSGQSNQVLPCSSCSFLVARSTYAFACSESHRHVKSDFCRLALPCRLASCHLADTVSVGATRWLGVNAHLALSRRLLHIFLLRERREVAFAVISASLGAGAGLYHLLQDRSLSAVRPDQVWRPMRTSFAPRTACESFCSSTTYADVRPPTVTNLIVAGSPEGCRAAQLRAISSRDVLHTSLRGGRSGGPSLVFLVFLPLSCASAQRRYAGGD
jgi:hypothetical protein